MFADIVGLSFEMSNKIKCHECGEELDSGEYMWRRCSCGATTAYDSVLLKGKVCFMDKAMIEKEPVSSPLHALLPNIIALLILLRGRAGRNKFDESVVDEINKLVDKLEAISECYSEEDEKAKRTKQERELLTEFFRFMTGNVYVSRSDYECVDKFLAR